MRNIETRLVAMALSALLLFTVLGGCTSGSSVQPPPAGAGKEATPAAPKSQDSKWDTVVKEAKKEGQLVIYSANGPEVRKLLTDTMKSKYGLEVDYVSAAGAELAQRILTERRSNIHIADAVLIGTQIFTNLKPAEAVVPLDNSLLLPEVVEPKAWPEGRLPFLDKAHTGIGLTGAYWSYILVNSDMVKDADLTSFQDLLNPIWKDKILMGNPTLSGATMNWMMFIKEKVIPGAEGEKFLQQLAGQTPAINHDYRIQVEWAARGKYPIVIGASGVDIVAQFKKEGAPVAWRRVKEGGLVHPSASIFGIVADAPHPNAAKVLLNWLLTKEGQEQYGVLYSQPGVRLGISTAGIDPFMIVIPGEKVYYWDEEFGFKTQTEGPKVGKEIFGALLK